MLPPPASETETDLSAGENLPSPESNVDIKTDTNSVFMSASLEYILSLSFIFINSFVGLILLFTPSAIATRILPSAFTDHRNQGALYLSTIALTGFVTLARSPLRPSSVRWVSMGFTCAVTLSNLLRGIANHPAQTSTWIWISFHAAWLLGLALHHKTWFISKCL